MSCEVDDTAHYDSDGDAIDAFGFIKPESATVWSEMSALCNKRYGSDYSKLYRYDAYKSRDDFYSCTTCHKSCGFATVADVVAHFDLHRQIEAHVQRLPKELGLGFLANVAVCDTNGHQYATFAEWALNVAQRFGDAYYNWDSYVPQN